MAGARTTTACAGRRRQDRKSTRLNSSHPSISYAVFCLKKKDNKARNLIFPSRHNKGQLIHRRVNISWANHVGRLKDNRHISREVELPVSNGNDVERIPA